MNGIRASPNLTASPITTRRASSSLFPADDRHLTFDLARGNREESRYNPRLPGNVRGPPLKVAAEKRTAEQKDRDFASLSTQRPRTNTGHLCAPRQRPEPGPNEHQKDRRRSSLHEDLRGDARTAAGVCVLARRFPEEGRKGGARRAESLPALAGGRAEQSPRPGPLAGAARSSAHRARRRQPLLGSTLRHRPRQDHRRPRHPGRISVAPPNCSIGSPWNSRPGACSRDGRPWAFGLGRQSLILKKIALSNTYQQSSAVLDSPAARIDPNNRLLSPSRRVSASPPRRFATSALAISGLLSPNIGGPSVMPYL